MLGNCEGEHGLLLRLDWFRTHEIGFGVNCSSSTISYNVDKDEYLLATSNQAPNMTYSGDMGNTVAFEVKIGYPMWRKYSGMDDRWGDELLVRTRFKNVTSCKGYIQVEQCTLRHEVVEYGINLAGNKILLRPRWQDDKFIANTKSNPSMIKYSKNKHINILPLYSDGRQAQRRLGKRQWENYAYLKLHRLLALRWQSQHDTRVKAPRAWLKWSTLGIATCGIGDHLHSATASLAQDVMKCSGILCR